MAQNRAATSSQRFEMNFHHPNKPEGNLQNANNRMYTEKTVETVQEVIDVINHARNNDMIVRVQGSRHSPADHIIEDGEAGILLTLAGEELKRREISKVDDEAVEVTVGAGCYIGASPKHEGVEGGTWDESLCHFLHTNNLALPCLGGITYQTVGGFMMTGSAGGSLKYGFGDVIEGITFVNGNGKKIECSKSKNSNTFYAVGVSMGLFGVITSVTFRFKKNESRPFRVTGSEKNVKFEKSYLKDKTVFKESLEQHDYCHLNWFPQKECNRVIQWTGKKTSKVAEDYKPFLDCWKAIGGSAALQFCNYALHSPNFLETTILGTKYEAIGCTLNLFVNECNDKEFCYEWYDALPSDNSPFVNNIMKVDFTEIMRILSVMFLGYKHFIIMKNRNPFVDPNY